MTNKKCICLDLKYKTKLIDLKKRIREVEKVGLLLLFTIQLFISSLGK